MAPVVWPCDGAGEAYRKYAVAPAAATIRIATTAITTVETPLLAR
ncbi:MAG TPA: hypothetical protein VKF39_04450 [Nitrososphaerales archaeon]|nr:hypothetical protein [Nitrososphaerales archaeon]